MDRLRRHKAKLAVACLLLGIVSLLRAQTTYCADADGVRADCNALRDQPGVTVTGGSVNVLDFGLGVMLVLAAPMVLIFIRRPY